MIKFLKFSSVVILRNSLHSTTKPVILSAAKDPDTAVCTESFVMPPLCKGYSPGGGNVGEADKRGAGKGGKSQI